MWKERGARVQDSAGRPKEFCMSQEEAVKTENGGPTREESLLGENESVEELFEGGLKIIQNRQLYRFTSDSILLTRFCRAKKGDEVADFCAGSGVVGLHFYGLHPNIASVTLFEMQEELSEMSGRSILLNGLQNFSAVCCRLQDIPAEYCEKFSLVLCNPPYERGGFAKEDYKKAICRMELTLTLPELTQAAARALKCGGRFALVHRADRLAEVFYHMKARSLEPKRLQFVRGREGTKPYLVLVEGVKCGKEGLDILPDLVNVRGEHF